MQKCEKRRKHLPLLYEGTYDNYFIVKYLLKSNMARASNILTYCIGFISNGKRQLELANVKGDTIT